jgi:glycosyltransferase involved in cell wall biosynthesis
MDARGAPRVLIIVENSPVPLDPRVWPECLALRELGYEVTVICPQGVKHARDSFEVLNGVEIHRYAPIAANGSRFSYAREYVRAFWKISRLVRRLAAKQRFDVVHGCNPPDLLLLAALPLKWRGTRFVFDHHDLVPELYMSRFGRGRDVMYRLALWLERIAFRLADVVIATNDSYRRVALGRGKKRAEDVFVVRNAPDLDRLQPQAPDPSLKRGREHLLSFVGIMGPQDGVDYGLRALRRLRDHRDDWHALFVGDGDMLEPMKELARELGIDDRVEFTGFIADPQWISRLLATSDVCLAPEPKSPLNDASTMIKVAEYLAMARPVVAFELTETKVTAGEAALYAAPNDVESFASCIDRLLDDPDLRARMGLNGRERIENGLSWETSKRSLAAAYQRAVGDAPATAHV